MRHATETIEYGRIQDPSPSRQYVVTSSLSAGNLRVWMVESESEPELVCTIFNVRLLPLASWHSRWIGNMRHWKQWLVDQATGVYQRHRSATPGHDDTPT